MELLTLLLTILNTILIVLLGLKYFKDNYTIVSIQDWNTLANFYNDHADEYDAGESRTVRAQRVIILLIVHPSPVL